MDAVTHAGIAVVARDTQRLLLIQRAWDETDPEDVRGTWEFPGGSLEDDEDPQAGAWREFCEETGCPQPEGEVVNGWSSEGRNGNLYQGFVYSVPSEREAFAEINPDADAADTVNPDDPERTNPDITAWFTVEQLRGLGAALRPEVAQMDWSVFDLEDEMTEMQTARKWFGVLAPEGVRSGDRRMFSDGALRMRALPLPLTWQKISGQGHNGNVVTGIIQQVWRENGLIWGAGEYLNTPEADEHYNLVEAFGRYGVSIDADDLDEFAIEMTDDGVTVFTDARVCSTCAVSIPAFAEAWMINGNYEDFAADFAGGWGAPSQEIPTRENEGQAECEERDEDGNCIERDDEEVTASAEACVGCAEEEPCDPENDPECVAEEDHLPKKEMPYSIDFRVETPITFLDVAPGLTEDGPGWLTHPVDTDRLRDYWVRGEGAAKIGWGAPDDFYRCEAHVAEYVKPQYIKGYCANRHYDALGYWPGQAPHQGENMTFTTGTSTTVNGIEVGTTDDAPLALTAGAPMKNPPKDWFENPGLPGVTPLTVTQEGRVFGHLATWGQCHVGIGGECVMLPRSQSDYSYFHIGVIETDGGEVFTGPLVMGGKHAGERLDWRAATQYYDTTSAVIADVRVGEDEFGVWMSGALRDGVTDEQIREIKAAGKASGDWREVVRGSRQLELIAALAVNVGGFPVPRTRVAVHGSRVVSLVAAGIVEDDPIGEIADEVVARIAARQSMDALQSEVYGPEIQALREEIGD